LHTPHQLITLGSLHPPSMPQTGRPPRVCPTLGTMPPRHDHGTGCMSARPAA
jgi:hypothetical protein